MQNLAITIQPLNITPNSWSLIHNLFIFHLFLFNHILHLKSWENQIFSSSILRSPTPTFECFSQSNYHFRFCTLHIYNLSHILSLLENTHNIFSDNLTSYNCNPSNAAFLCLFLAQRLMDYGPLNLASRFFAIPQNLINYDNLHSYIPLHKYYFPESNRNKASGI